MAWIDAEVGDQLGDQSRDEPDVVDSLPVGHRRTAAVGPTEVDAVGVDHDEPVRIGYGVVVRFPLPTGSDRAGTVQIDDETRRMLEARRHVQAVCAGQASDVEPPRLACRCGRSTTGKTHNDTEHGRQRKMATTSDGQARTCHWRYWTAATTGALNYSETFTNRSTVGKVRPGRVPQLRGGPLVGGPPAAVQPLAIRDEQRLGATVFGAYRHRGRELGGTAARDDDGGQSGGGRRAQT